jgi:hypothetical protein
VAYYSDLFGKGFADIPFEPLALPASATSVAELDPD